METSVTFSVGAGVPILGALSAVLGRVASAEAAVAAEEAKARDDAHHRLRNDLMKSVLELSNRTTRLEPRLDSSDLCPRRRGEG